MDGSGNYILIGQQVSAGKCPRCHALLTADDESIVCSDPDCEWRPTELTEDLDACAEFPRL